jgi:hypothetical protein
MLPTAQLRRSAGHFRRATPRRAWPFLPLAVTALIGNTAGLKLSAKMGNRFVILPGMLVMVACVALLTTVSADSASPSR